MIASWIGCSKSVDVVVRENSTVLCLNERSVMTELSTGTDPEPSS